MHQVWRKTQGLPWEPSVSGGLAANVEHLVSVEAKPNPQPIPADALGLAFGALSHPKLVKQITDPSLVLRQKALAHVCEEIRSTKELQSFLVAGLVPAANTAAGDADQAVRTSASSVLARAARDHAGQEQMLEHASVAVLLKLLADGVGEVRANVLAAIRELGRARAGAAALGAAAVLGTIGVLPLTPSGGGWLVWVCCGVPLFLQLPTLALAALVRSKGDVLAAIDAATPTLGRAAAAALVALAPIAVVFPTAAARAHGWVLAAAAAAGLVVAAVLLPIAHSAVYPPPPPPAALAPRKAADGGLSEISSLVREESLRV